MDAVLERCAGLDVHQEEIVACVMYGPLEKRPKKETQTFLTTTKGLLALHDWLESFKCTHVAMESTGVYWKPVWNILEGSFELILANAKRIKNVPGRKTDVSDAAWITQLLRCGLITPSFVPPENFRDLRDYTRYRRKLVGNASSEKNRIHKILQDANVKLTTFVSDLFGVSGRALLESIINGEVLTEEQVRSLVKTSLKRKVPQLVDALNGRVRQHHRKIIRMHYDHLIYLEKQISELEGEIDRLITPYNEYVELLDTIPGVSFNAIAVIIAEIGVDMSCFPCDKHLASWGGLCPGNNESAGKKKSSRTQKGNRSLKGVLCQAAWSASKSKGTRLSSFFYRVQKRRGQYKASMATAHLILRIIYHIIKDKIPYEELGWDYAEKDTERKINYWIKNIESKGFKVTVEQPTA
ncbi:IS110 family transposase [Evansella cellulosilytica]|uniref:Transposase IS116/IS110/IS902 family protein n=1 Tax=Evansella cellulosilytica (strain ATCC 21833 / DSM 2522 / FERM P-1141 / JCM 9156 / N-4) TaxID=649639 RepID=E6TTL2_EVAC2|nr:IS110 family transposase [Evansella cellulosilytica]ADU29648.1 transposase IS116/IS110/IS902 family protein [Evansella cellulosilytica DSM 2522]